MKILYCITFLLGIRLTFKMSILGTNRSHDIILQSRYRKKYE